MFKRLSCLASLLFLVIGLLSGHTFGQSTPALIDWTGEVAVQTVTGTLGWVFTTNEPIIVTHLGVFDGGGDGLNESHAIGLWRVVDTELVTTTVPSGTAATLEDDYRYVPISGVILDAGQTFVIGAHFTGFQEEIRHPTTSYATDPAITWVEGRNTGFAGGALTVPTIVNPAPGTFAMNFKFVPVPEPSSIAMLVMGGLALLGSVVHRRRHSR